MHAAVALLGKPRIVADTAVTVYPFGTITINKAIHSKVTFQGDYTLVGP